MLRTTGIEEGTGAEDIWKGNRIVFNGCAAAFWGTGAGGSEVRRRGHGAEGGNAQRPLEWGGDLLTAELKSLGLMSLTEETSGQTDINSASWLLTTILLHVSNGEEQAGKREMPMHNLGRRSTSGNSLMEPRLVLKETETQ